MAYFFTSESVSEGHPDKVADQISDAILDAMLTQDPNSRVACETLVTTGLVTLAGELNTHAKVDFQQIARDTITKIGYTKDEYKFSANSCAIVSALHTQSPDIAQGVDEGEDKEQGAGDQGMMFGYATDESDSYMPLTLVISHLLMSELARIRREGKVMKYLRPDAKSQVTIEYDDNHHPIRITTIVVSTQHDEMIKSDNKKDADTQMQNQIKDDVIKYLIPAVKNKLSQRVQKLFDDKIKYYVNPTGLFIIGGPHGDAGLTGRKIIVDTYGGRGAHGGGAFSGKDPSKVDRSAAYAARHIAKNLVAAGVSEQALVQLSYAIGIAEPISINVNTFGTAKIDLSDSQISDKIIQEFNAEFKPKSIIERLKLKNPIYSETAAYGHMGRDSYTKDVQVAYQTIEEKSNQKTTIQKFETKQIEFFTWEKLDYVDRIKNLFNL